MSTRDRAASGSRLERELRERGLCCRVEVRDALAILLPWGELPDDAGRWREAAVPLARELGFTHVALELPGEAPHGAALSRD